MIANQMDTDEIVDIPFPEPRLIGRAEALEQLHSCLRVSDAAVSPVITGQGGIGKTQLAVAYGNRFKRHWRGGVFWINAAGSLPDAAASLRGQFSNFALRYCDLKYSDVEEARAQIFTGWLRKRRDTLLIVDNLENPELLQTRFVPGVTLASLPCRKLITSRRRGLQGYKDFPVDLLSPEEAFELLVREAGTRPGGAAEHEAAKDICSMLGRLPLALRIAGRLVDDGVQPNFSALARTLRDQGLGKSLADLTLDDYERSIRVVQVESWQSLPVGSELARKVMWLLSCLPQSSSIRIALLEEILEPDPGAGSAVKSAIKVLCRRNILEQPTEDHVRQHPLLREFAASAMPPDFLDPLAGEAALRLRGPSRLKLLSSASVLLQRDEARLIAGALPAGEMQEKIDVLARALDQETPSIMAGFPPLVQLQFRALLLSDRELMHSCEEVLVREGRHRLRPMWSTATVDPAFVYALEDSAGAFGACALSADGRIALVASFDLYKPSSWKVWDIITGNCCAVLEGDIARITSCALSADGRVALLESADGKVRIWDLKTGTCRGILLVWTAPDGIKRARMRSL